jgi:hypothetical protein
VSARVSELGGAVLIGLCTFGVGGQADAQPLGGAGMIKSGMIEVVVSVELSCPSCAQGLERRFSRLEPVERVEIQVDQGRVVLGLAPGTTIGLKEVWDVVRNAGFTADELVLTAVGRVVVADGRTALGLPDDRVLALDGPRVGALVAAAGQDLVQVRGAVTLANDGGAHVLTVGGFSLP